MPATAQVEPTPQLRSSLVKDAAYQRTIWVARVPSNVFPDDLLKPEFWSHKAADLKPWDRIEVRRDDRDWYAEVMVLDCGPNWARCVMQGLWPLRFEGPSSEVMAAEVLADAFAQHQIDFRGSAGWSVIRRSDGEILVENLGTRDAGEDWLRGWARKNMTVSALNPVPAEPAGADNLTSLIQPGSGDE